MIEPMTSERLDELGAAVSECVNAPYFEGWLEASKMLVKAAPALIALARQSDALAKQVAERDARVKVLEEALCDLGNAAMEVVNGVVRATESVTEIDGEHVLVVEQTYGTVGKEPVQRVLSALRDARSLLGAA